MSELRISAGRAFPLDIVTEALAILARRGRGKTYTASVLAEEMLEQKVQTVVIDPTGAWWGLREGYPVIIMGGEHGDVPLEPSAGIVVADFVVDEGFSVVLDLSLFESRADEVRFVTAFAERLYRRKKKGTGVLHVFIDEASVFAPQNVRGDTARMVGAIEAIVRRGRIKGLGCTLIDQRPASVNKNVLTQAKGLLVLGVSAPTDRKAIMEWVQARGADLSKEMIDSLPSMEVGEAWVWLPDLDIFERVQIRKRKTFDSSATPKPGEKVREPKKWSDVDLAAVQSRMAETIERAKADDPKELKKQLAALRKDLRSAESKAADAGQVEVPVEVEVEVEVPVEIPVLSKEDRDHIWAVLEDLRNQFGRIEKRLDEATKERTRMVTSAPIKPAPKSRTRRSTPPSRPASTDISRDIGGDNGDLGKGERTVLNVLAQWPDGRTHNELAFLAGYSAKASTLGVILSKLRKMNLVGPGQPIKLTPEGEAFVGGFEELPTGQELLDRWMSHPRMGEGERKVLRALIDNHPDDVSHAELCEMTGYSPDASTIGVILSKLRKLGLVEKGRRRVPDEFMEAIS